AVDVAPAWAAFERKARETGGWSEVILRVPSGAAPSVLFVAALRASGVPARALYGRWAASAVPDATLGGAAYLQWHVKAEFFAAGVGWVPADPGGAVQHDRTPGGLTYFGTDPGDFITFHTDPHLALDTGTTGVRPVRNLQTPVWWVTGRGPTTPTRVVEDWKVEAK
ncbi:transglutaminase domain-containing protein, partial [bacterium]|nr:transglutaminase domain-containing protein [bacterium]